MTSTTAVSEFEGSNKVSLAIDPNTHPLPTRFKNGLLAGGNDTVVVEREHKHFKSFWSRTSISVSVRTSHTSPPALTTKTCTSLPFTNPAFTTPSLAQRPETRTTTRWERTRNDRQRNEETLRDREEKQLRKFGPSLRELRTFWARDRARQS